MFYKYFLLMTWLFFFSSAIMSSEFGKEEWPLVDYYKKLGKQVEMSSKVSDSIFSKSESEPIDHSFSYYDNPNLREQIVNYIALCLFDANILSGQKLEDSLLKVKRILKYYDFHLISDFLYSLRESKSDDFIVDQQFVKTINANRHFRLFGELSPKELFFLDSVESVISSDLSGISVFVYEDKYREVFLQFFDDSNGNPGSYIDSHYDLPGINSLVRKGLVKSIVLSNGQIVVTKRDNPEKKGRFANEQRNIIRLKELLGLDLSNSSMMLENIAYDRKPWRLKLIQPFSFFIDGESKKIYSLSPMQKGITLEELLLSENNQLIRNYHFKNIGFILDFLYEKGVIWGDMAPRNIIVEEESDFFYYCILDFEKTRILDRPINLNERIEHCRGPMCVEEFGAICSKHEVEGMFLKYFTPSKWDLVNKSPILLEKPKREILDILKGREIENPTFGNYNTLEQEVMEVRFPLFQNHLKRFPLNISFKVDHYFGSDYDRKTTEILIFSKKHNYIFPLMDILEQSIENMENKLIVSDLISISKGHKSVGKSEHNYESKFLMEIIDQIHSSLNFPDYCEKLISKYSCFLRLYQNHFQQSMKKDGISLSMNNFKALDPILSQILREASEKFSPFLIVASGGFARKELTHGSDLDIAISENKDYPNVKEYISSEVKQRLGMDVEFFKDIPDSAKEIKNYFYENPDLFLDFTFSKVLSGDPDYIKEFHSSIKFLSKDKSYLQSVFSYESSQIDHFAIPTPLLKIKKCLNYIKIFQFLEKNNIKKFCESKLDYFNLCKKYLIFYKDFLNISINNSFSEEFVLEDIHSSLVDIFESKNCISCL